MAPTAMEAAMTWPEVADGGFLAFTIVGVAWAIAWAKVRGK